MRDAQAARLFSERLAACVGAERAAGATVTTARALALDVLADDGARRWSGREPRLLTAFEETFLMEDMKGERAAAEAAAQDAQSSSTARGPSWRTTIPDWLLPGGETDVHTLLKESPSLHARRRRDPKRRTLLRALPPRNTTKRGRRDSYAHVLMDDYACASHASQTLANLVATCSITVAGDAETCIETYDSYPYAAGIDEIPH